MIIASSNNPVKYKLTKLFFVLLLFASASISNARIESFYPSNAVVKEIFVDYLPDSQNGTAPVIAANPEISITLDIDAAGFSTSASVFGSCYLDRYYLTVGHDSPLSELDANTLLLLREAKAAGSVIFLEAFLDTSSRICTFKSFVVAPWSD